MREVGNHEKEKGTPTPTGSATRSTAANAAHHSQKWAAAR